MKDLHAGNGEKTTQHDHLTLGEVYDLGGVVYDVKAHADEGIDRSYGHAGDEVLEDLLG